MTMEPHTVALPCLPRRSLSSIFSTIVGGRTFKAPSKAEWPHRVECLTTTTWHSGGMLPYFTHGVAVAAIDVRSHTNWVRQALQTGELMTAFEIPASTQATFAPEVITQVCASLPSLTPVGVLRVLLSILVPLKGRSFMGGGSPLEKLPSRQKVAMLEIANTRHASSLSTSKRIVRSAKSMPGSPSYPYEGIDVSATSLLSSPSYYVAVELTVVPVVPVGFTLGYVAVELTAVPVGFTYVGITAVSI
jgi:hypothetical protein